MCQGSTNSGGSKHTERAHALSAAVGAVCLRQVLPPGRPCSDSAFRNLNARLVAAELPVFRSAKAVRSYRKQLRLRQGWPQQQQRQQQQSAKKTSKEKSQVAFLRLSTGRQASDLQPLLLPARLAQGCCPGWWVCKLAERPSCTSAPCTSLAIWFDGGFFRKGCSSWASLTTFRSAKVPARVSLFVSAMV